MNGLSLAHVVAERQQPRQMDNVVELKGSPEVSDIFCPMCEVWHENASWCQAPAMEGY